MRETMYTIENAEGKTLVTIYCDCAVIGNSCGFIYGYSTYKYPGVLRVTSLEELGAILDRAENAGMNIIDWQEFQERR